MLGKILLHVQAFYFHNYKHHTNLWYLDAVIQTLFCKFAINTVYTTVSSLSHLVASLKEPKSKHVNFRMVLGSYCVPSTTEKRF